MQAKYNMTVAENIFVAKRNIVDYIWKSANLEGIAVTYPETEAIYNGMSVDGYTVDEIISVNNLKYAWQFVLEHTEYPTDYPFICKINEYVGGRGLIHNAGTIRTMDVSIGGTEWRPDIPLELDVKEELAGIFQDEGVTETERAITLMLYCMRRQLFLDGNKRTSMLVANHVMIRNGCGVIAIPLKLQLKFTKLLVQFYETNDMNDIRQFIYDNCIDGMEFLHERNAGEQIEKEKNLRPNERER